MGPAETRALLDTAFQSLNAGQIDEAAKRFEQVLALDADNLDALRGLGFAALDRADPAGARACFADRLSLAPQSLEAMIDLAEVCFALGDLDEAARLADRALEILPEQGESNFLRGRLYLEAGDDASALRSLGRASMQGPECAAAFESWLMARIEGCDWRLYDALTELLRRGVRAGRYACEPLGLMFISDSPSEMLQCARTHRARRHPPQPALITKARTPGNRIRIAFLSPDFHNHPVAHLFAPLLEALDHHRFEFVGVGFRRASGHAVRKRLEAGFDRFIDAQDLDDAAVARQLADLSIDIAVSLGGFTQGARPGVLAHRPAPVQVNYLGYPGTMASPYIDYIVADRRTAPDDSFLDEKVVRLPDCYLPGGETMVGPTSSRAAEGLPVDGPVLMSFGRTSKLAPGMYGAWMRILQATPAATLWLAACTAEAEANLRAQAQAARVDPARLVVASFAPDRAAHLARHELADIFLDTSPFNAHSTALDALRCGVPVVTLRGSAFSGRVGESLVCAAGLPELVADDLAAYEALAISLCADPARLAALRRRLSDEAWPLFDLPRYAAHLRTAFETMYRRSLAGAPPESFDVEPSPGTRFTRG